MAVTCEGLITSLFGPDQDCYQFSERILRVGCVHEHVDLVRLCTECAERLLEGEATCLACYDLPGEDGHDCAMLGRAETD